MREKEFLQYALDALQIESLNAMQRRMLDVATEHNEIVLLSPTGTGKTLAFVLPVLKLLRPSNGHVQAVVIAPTRELVLQICTIFRKSTPSIRVVALYGGHKVEDEINSLRTIPDVAVCTPGRLLDHIKRGNIDVWSVRICVLDEYDKTLELGFEQDVSKIFKHLKNVSRIILTSATSADTVPEFIELNNPLILNYLDTNKELRNRIRIYEVRCDKADKLEGLYDLLQTIVHRSEDGMLGKTIVFVNHRESAERVYSYLKRKGVGVIMYHGALDQTMREKALALFMTGARPVMVSTDLGARGLDIENVRNVVHYHVPVTEDAYTHRNGRTARVEADGNVFVMLGPDEIKPAYVNVDEVFDVEENLSYPLSSGLETLTVSGGRREKVSKGDILGWLVKEAGVPGADVGAIHIGDHYSLVCLPTAYARQIVNRAKSHKIKGQKRPVHIL